MTHQNQTRGTMPAHQNLRNQTPWTDTKLIDPAQTEQEEPKPCPMSYEIIVLILTYEPKPNKKQCSRHDNSFNQTNDDKSSTEVVSMQVVPSKTEYKAAQGKITAK